jgi:hypothetical protein
MLKMDVEANYAHSCGKFLTSSDVYSRRTPDISHRGKISLGLFTAMPEILAV